MLSIKRACPVDYRLCNQTVTVYHRDGDTYTRRVFSNAFFDFKKNENVDKAGSSETNSFLLIIPCAEQVVFNGDKVLLGVGGDIANREAWAALVPAKVNGLAVVKYVDMKYWNGQAVHLEAGG